MVNNNTKKIPLSKEDINRNLIALRRKSSFMDFMGNNNNNIIYNIPYNCICIFEYLAITDEAINDCEILKLKININDKYNIYIYEQNINTVIKLGNLKKDEKLNIKFENVTNDSIVSYHEDDNAIIILAYGFLFKINFDKRNKCK